MFDPIAADSIDLFSMPDECFMDDNKRAWWYVDSITKASGASFGKTSDGDRLKKLLVYKIAQCLSLANNTVILKYGVFYRMWFNAARKVDDSDSGDWYFEKKRYVYKGGVLYYYIIKQAMLFECNHRMLSHADGLLRRVKVAATRTKAAAIGRRITIKRDQWPFPAVDSGALRVHRRRAPVVAGHNTPLSLLAQRTKALNDALELMGECTEIFHELEEEN